MRIRSAVWAALLAAAALSLGRALVTHDGVGPIEYAVGIALVVLLCLTAVRALRRAASRAVAP
jgi:hypothetical protein